MQVVYYVAWFSTRLVLLICKDLYMHRIGLLVSQRQLLFYVHTPSRQTCSLSDHWWQGCSLTCVEWASSQVMDACRRHATHKQLCLWGCGYAGPTPLCSYVVTSWLRLLWTVWFRTRLSFFVPLKNKNTQTNKKKQQHINTICFTILKWWVISTQLIRQVANWLFVAS